MPTSPESYLSSLDSTQIAELISALEQRGLIPAPAALPTAPGPILLAASNHHSHAPSTLSGSEATVSIADVGTSSAVIPETNGKPLSQPYKPTAPGKASRGWSTGSTGQHGCPTVQSTWYTVTVGYQVGIFQGWNAVAPSVVDIDSAVYLPHPSHAAACAHYTDAMANDAVEIVLTNSDNNA
ncbi:hypothetical protein EDD18DRAFT_1344120 [Armillaria luteobubalina]|uniref:Ribonuclease H1 N-terminal domain-containing protein n=1 Tax=Armillaria luteobubalina TaxID=153913 RepID=A0AA39U0P1_9AGAR|nr:hypothetical protein EDD18DRAFT_1344120 [Armillaria luteobubalina]